MIKVAICDDIEEVCMGLENVLKKHTFSSKIQIDYFCTGDQLFNSFVKKQYDLILLDIELSDDSDIENGLLISNKIKNVYPNVIIIFFTGKSGYERELLNFEPFRFLSKPIKEKDLILAVEAAIKRLEGWEEKYFSFKINGIGNQINIKEIIYFVSQSPYISIQCIDDQVKFRGKMDSIEHELAQKSSEFIRVSKSYLVNKQFIRSYTTKEIVLSNGEKITITRKYTQNFNEIIRKE